MMLLNITLIPSDRLKQTLPTKLTWSERVCVCVHHQHTYDIKRIISSGMCRYQRTEEIEVVFEFAFIRCTMKYVLLRGFWSTEGTKILTPSKANKYNLNLEIYDTQMNIFFLQTLIFVLYITDDNGFHSLSISTHKCMCEICVWKFSLFSQTNSNSIRFNLLNLLKFFFLTN